MTTPTPPSAQERAALLAQWWQACGSWSDLPSLTTLVEKLIAQAVQANADLLDRALGALADIAHAEDMTEAQRRHKAARIYDAIDAAVRRAREENT